MRWMVMVVTKKTRLELISQWSRDFKIVVGEGCHILAVENFEMGNDNEGQRSVAAAHRRFEKTIKGRQRLGLDA